MFILSLDYIKNIQSLNSEMNIICQAEPQYTLTQNVIREMILNSSKPILNNNSFTVAKDSIENAYGLNQQILTTHNSNSGIDSAGYNS